MIGVEAGASWSYDDLKFHGMSLSGIRTCLTMPEFQISFDVAQGYPFAVPMRKFFMTHGHADHAAGIPYLISQKNLFRMPTPDFYMPPSLVEPLTKIIKLWEGIEDHQYNYKFHPVTAEEIQINPYHFVKPFKTFHRIESFGYTLFNRNKKLAPKWKDAKKEEIIKAKERGESINELVEAPLVSFTGDTKIEFLFGEPWIRKSRILFLESTYLDDKKTIQQARDWGHTHLDEIIPHLNEIESEKIVLIHISSRYSYEHALSIVRKKIPKEHYERIVVFPGR
jgi:ribonuclease Z